MARPGNLQAHLQQGRNYAAQWIQINVAATEARFARAIARDNEGGWLYDADAGHWLQWLGTHWGREQTPEFMQLVAEYVTAHAEVLFQAKLIPLADRKSFQSNRTHGAIEKACRVLPTMLARHTMFDVDPYLFNTPGGTIELRTGLIRPANPHDYITVLAPIAPAPAGTPAPMWEAFLDFVTGGDREVARTLQEWIGSSMTGEAPDQRLVFLFGQGGNGKSVFIQVMAQLMGGYHQAADPGLLIAKSGSGDHPAGIAKVVKARMVSAVEVPHNAAWNTALIKLLTGGDILATRFMHQNFFDVMPACSITVAGNEKPALHNVDEAVRRRFLLIDFGSKVENPIRAYDRKLVRAEGPAILNWMLEGAKRRLLADDLYVAPAIIEASNIYFSEEDMVRQFIEERCEIATLEELNADPGAWETRTTHLFDNYRMFAQSLGRQAGSRNPFSNKLAAITGLPVKHTMHGNVIIGLKLNYA